MKTIKIKLTFTEPVLGTSPTNEDIYRDFIGSKAPDAATIDDEVAALGVGCTRKKAGRRRRAPLPHFSENGGF